MIHQNCLRKLRLLRCNKCSLQFSYLHREFSRDILRCDLNLFNRPGRIRRLNNTQVYLINIFSYNCIEQGSFVSHKFLLIINSYKTIVQNILFCSQ